MAELDLLVWFLENVVAPLIGVAFAAGLILLALDLYRGRRDAAKDEAAADDQPSLKSQEAPHA